LQNAYLKGQDDYPKTFEEAKRLLSNWKAPQASAFVRPPTRSDGVAFIQSGGKAESNPKDKAGKPVLAPEKKTNSKGESHYYNCGESDHWSSECPHDKMLEEQRAELTSGEQKILMNVQEEMDEEEYADDVSLLNVALLQGKKKRNGLSDDRLYLDKCSTVTAVKNPAFLNNVRDAD